jgi:hypothetical protein
MLKLRFGTCTRLLRVNSFSATRTKLAPIGAFFKTFSSVDNDSLPVVTSAGAAPTRFTLAPNSAGLTITQKQLAPAVQRLIDLCGRNLMEDVKRCWSDLAGVIDIENTHDQSSSRYAAPEVYTYQLRCTFLLNSELSFISRSSKLYMPTRR